MPTGPKRTSHQCRAREEKTECETHGESARRPAFALDAGELARASQLLVVSFAAFRVFQRVVGFRKQIEFAMRLLALAGRLAIGVQLLGPRAERPPDSASGAFAGTPSIV